MRRTEEHDLDLFNTSWIKMHLTTSSQSSYSFILDMIKQSNKTNTVKTTRMNKACRSLH